MTAAHKNSFREELLSARDLRVISVVPSVFQHREAIRETTVREYMVKYRNGEKLPPMKVAKINDGLFLIDGFHRYEALNRLFELDRPEDVTILIVECKDEIEASWIGAQDNMRHGLPLTRKERRNIFRVYVKAKKHWKVYRKEYKSWRQIAQDMGIDHKTAQRWMKADFRKIWERMLDDGGCDMSDVDTMKENEVVTLAMSAIGNINEAYRASLGIEDTAEKLKVIRHFQSTCKQMMKEHLGFINPREVKGVFREYELDF